MEGSLGHVSNGAQILNAQRLSETFVQQVEYAV